MSRLTILGTGGHTLPVVGNRELLEFIGAPKDSVWLEETTGARGHSLNFDCTTGCKRTPDTGLDWAERAARQALETAAVEAGRIDQLCLTTCTPASLHFMADTIELHRRLGLRPTTVVSQIDSGGTGLAKVLQEVHAYARCVSSRWTALVVAANDVSSFLSGARDRRVSSAWLWPALFADGAGAVVLGEGNGPRLVDVYCAVHGNHALVASRGGAAVPLAAETVDAQAYLMNAGVVAAHWGAGMQRAWKWLSDKWGLHIGDVQRWYVHQASYRFIEGFIAAFGIAPDRVPHNVERVGNTVSASTLLLLDEDRRSGRPAVNGPIVFLWVGAGMMEGGALFMA